MVKTAQGVRKMFAAYVHKKHISKALIRRRALSVFDICSLISRFFVIIYVTYTSAFHKYYMY